MLALSGTLNLGQSVCFIISFVDFIFLQTILVFFMFIFFPLHVFIPFIRSHYYSPFLFFNFFPFTPLIHKSFLFKLISTFLPLSFCHQHHQVFPSFLPLHFIYSTVLSQPYPSFRESKKSQPRQPFTLRLSYLVRSLYSFFSFLHLIMFLVLFRSTFLAPQDSLLRITSSFFHCPVLCYRLRDIL
jgi:hypothetical protein